MVPAVVDSVPPAMAGTSVSPAVGGLVTGARDLARISGLKVFFLKQYCKC